MVDLTVVSNNPSLNASRPRHERRLIERCVKLRVEGRKSTKQIADEVGQSKTTVHYWLRNYPLSQPEMATFRRQKESGRKQGPRNDTLWIAREDSKLWKLVGDDNLSSARKGRICEAAISTRLALLNFEVYQSVFGGAKIDIIARHFESNRLLKIQVRYASVYKSGVPFLKLVRSNGRGGQIRYCDDDFDFIVGYSVRTDTAFVFNKQQCSSHKFGISVTKDSEEAWHLLFSACDASGEAGGLSNR